MPTLNQPKGARGDTKKYSKGAYHEPRYNTQRWRNVRKLILQGSPLCAECKARDVVKLGSVIDHIKPVRLGGDFWDLENLQTLCESCHNSKSAKERHATRTG